MLDRTITTSISLSVSTYVYLRERAERERRSLSSVVREVIQRGLDTSGEPAAIQANECQLCASPTVDESGR